MKTKEFIDTFPFGYIRQRNLNESVALTLNTEETGALVFVKKISKSRYMPAFEQDDIDSFQSDIGQKKIIIDWYCDDCCRYMIMMEKQKKATQYHIILNALIGDDAFDIRGFFTEQSNIGIREKIYNDRYLKQSSNDELTTKTDFTREYFDMIFPDHPLSHCRRLANVIAQNAVYQAKSSFNDFPCSVSTSEPTEDGNDTNDE